LVLAGTSSRGDFVLGRYTAGGALGPSFDGGGGVTTDFGGAAEVAYALVRQPDGQLGGAGFGGGLGREEFGAGRYNPDGSLDSSFGTGGVVTTDLGGQDFARALVLQPDGKLVAAGFSTGSPGQLALVRYLPNGHLDGSFGNGGIATGPGGIAFAL